MSLLGIIKSDPITFHPIISICQNCDFLSNNLMFFFINCLDTKSGSWGPLSETIQSYTVYLILRPSLQNTYTSFNLEIKTQCFERENYF